ncbi:unnamed protein product [Effrenium voratum]|uniref:Thioredoxin domain-containing protein n=1 Tax=Effrenium voratum TaxID=2562239 RepID=A0AA36IHJ6_9DINO|nr:unnamed protein product [Effrenium voratum]CAJ1386449.1 unnamed protein product [Effrenium voratum]CAJ1433525.1 unnamed protein product [Effrenium voratum]|mmetsp:Transcript_51158/g.122532  ORF Transcript_51158/g.122532 Transcript_51158/m.122532 type:complete len:133 (+) Transcript_51158:52-450(+)
MAELGCECIPFARAEDGATSAPVSVIAFVQPWFGPSQMAVRQLLSAGPACGVDVFFVDADQEALKAHQLGIWGSPAMLFYARGCQLTIQRPEVDDATKYIGSITMEELESLLRQARECLTSSNTILRAGAHH